MDFAWVVDALRRGLKVTRKAWAGDPPMYLYMTHGATSDMHVIRLCTGIMEDTVWNPRHEDILDATDWEEYGEPKKAAPTKSTQEDLPVWPEVNADGYARMSKDSDVVVHDGVYRCKKAPSDKAAENTPELSARDKIRAKLLAEIFIQLLRKDLFYPDESHSKEN